MESSTSKVVFSSAPFLDTILGAIAACYSSGDPQAHAYLDAYRESAFAWQGIHELLSCTSLPPGLPSHLTLVYVHHFSSTLALNKVKADWKSITDENEKQNVRSMFLYYLKARCAAYMAQPSSIDAAIIANIASSLAFAAVYDQVATQLVQDSLAMVHDSLFAAVAILTALAQAREKLHLAYSRLNALNMELASVASSVFDLAESMLSPLTPIIDPSSPISLRSLSHKHPANEHIPVPDPDAFPLLPLRVFLAPPASPPSPETYQGTLSSLSPPQQTSAALELLAAWTPIAASPAALLATTRGTLLCLLLALLSVDAYTEQAAAIVAEALTLQSFPKPALHDRAVALVTAAVAEWSVRVWQRSFVAHVLPDTPLTAPAVHHSLLYTAGVASDFGQRPSEFQAGAAADFLSSLPPTVVSAVKHVTEAIFPSTAGTPSVTLPPASSFPAAYRDADKAEAQLRSLAFIATTLADNETFTLAKGSPAALSLTNAMLLLLAHPHRTTLPTIALDYFIALQAVPMQSRSRALTAPLFLSVFVVLVLQITEPGAALAWVIRNIDSVCITNNFPETLFSQRVFSVLSAASRLSFPDLASVMCGIAAHVPDSLSILRSLRNAADLPANIPQTLRNGLLFDAAEETLASDISLLSDQLLAGVRSHYAASEEDEDAVAMLCGQIEAVTGDFFAILEENSIHVLLAAMGAVHPQVQQLVSHGYLRPLPSVFLAAPHATQHLGDASQGLHALSPMAHTPRLLSPAPSSPFPSSSSPSPYPCPSLSALERHYRCNDAGMSLAMAASGLRCLSGMAEHVKDMLEDCQCNAARLELAQLMAVSGQPGSRNGSDVAGTVLALQQVTDEYKKHGLLLHNLLSPFLEHILGIFSHTPRDVAAKSPLTPLLCQFLSNFAFLWPLIAPHLLLRLLTLTLSLTDAMAGAFAAPASLQTYTDILTAISSDNTSSSTTATTSTSATTSASASATAMAAFAEAACTSSLLPVLSPLRAFNAICKEAKSSLSLPTHATASPSPSPSISSASSPSNFPHTPSSPDGNSLTGVIPGLNGFLALFTPSHLSLACPSTTQPLPYALASSSSSSSPSSCICTAAPTPISLHSLPPLSLPLSLPSSSLHTLLSSLAVILRGLPSAFASGMLHTFASPLISSLHAAVAATQRCPMSSLPHSTVAAIAVAFLSVATTATSALTPLFFENNPPNLDTASGITTSAFGIFEETGDSLRKAAVDLYTALWPTLDQIILLIPSISNIPDVYQDLSDLSQRVSQRLNHNTHLLPLGLATPAPSTSLPASRATPASRLSSSLADCLHAAVTIADTSLAAAVPVLVARLRDLYCASVVHQALFAPVLRVIAAAMDIYGADKGTHTFFSTVLASVVRHTHTIVANTPSEPAFTHTDALTQLLKLLGTAIALRPDGVLPSGVSWQQAPNYSLYGAAWMHTQELIPRVSHLITVAVAACASERELARYVFDVSASLGVSLCRDAQVHYMLHGCNVNKSHTTIDDDGVCANRFYAYTYSEDEWTFDQGLQAQLPPYTGDKCLFWVQNGAPTAASEAVGHLLSAFIRALAGDPDLPQELYNKAASAILGFLASAPPALQHAWTQACLASDSLLSGTPPQTRALMAQVLCMCAAKVVRGDVYGQERRFRMMIRDFAASLRNPAAGIEALEDYIQ